MYRLEHPEYSVGAGKSWIPAPPDIRDSSNGQLRVEQFVGIWSPTRRVGRWAQITDLRYGTIVLDTAAIPLSEAIWLDGSTLLLRIDLDGRQGMFRIESEYMRFRNLATGDPARPVAKLQEEILAETERVLNGEGAGVRDPGWCEREFSATGSFRIDFECHESGHGAVTRSPKIVLTDSDEVVLDLTTFAARWSGSAHFFRRPTGPTDGTDPELVQLFLYRGDFRRELLLRPVDRKGRVYQQGEPWLSLSELRARIDGQYEEMRASRGFSR